LTSKVDRKWRRYT